MREIAAYVLSRRREEGIIPRINPQLIQGSDEEYGYMNYTVALVHSVPTQESSTSLAWTNLNNQNNRRGVINYIRYGKRFY